MIRQNEMWLEGAEVEEGRDKASCVFLENQCRKRVFAGIKDAGAKELLRGLDCSTNGYQ